MTPTMRQTKVARKGPQQALRRHAAGAHDDQFGIPVQPVQRVEGRQEQGDRRDHADKGRQGQAGDRQEDEKRLAPCRSGGRAREGPA